MNGQQLIDGFRAQAAKAYPDHRDSAAQLEIDLLRAKVLELCKERAEDRKEAQEEARSVAAEVRWADRAKAEGWPAGTY